MSDKRKKIIITYDGDIDLCRVVDAVRLVIDGGRESTARGVAKYCHYSVFGSPSEFQGIAIYARDRRSEDSPDSFDVRKETQ